MMTPTALLFTLLTLVATDAAASTAHRIRAGETTSVEETERLLRQIALHETSIGASVDVFDAALEAARTRDAEAARGDWRGSLHGVPFAVKDLFELKGRPTTAGFSTPAIAQGRSNASAVQRLLDDGAILIGTTRLTEGAWTEYAAGSTPPQNPFAPGLLWQGDSSSGCGVGVASGFFPSCLATDTSGSIRNPSLMNSLVGVKPQRGLIDGTGVWPLSPRLDTVGVMTRTAAEAASVLAAFDPGRSYGGGAENMTIGVDMSLVDEASLVETLRDAAALFRGQGIRVVDLTGQVQALVPLMDALAASSRATIAHDASRFYRDSPLPMGGQLRELVELDVSEAEYKAIEDTAASFAERWAASFGALDAVMLNVWGRPAPLDAEIPEIVTNPAVFAEAVRFMVPFNYADLPLVVVPAAASECDPGGTTCPFADRPRAFQLVGTSEPALLRLAAAFDEARGELRYPLDAETESDCTAKTAATYVAAAALFL